VYCGHKEEVGNTPSGLMSPLPLDTEPFVTESDIATIDALNEQYVQFMDKCIAQVGDRHSKVTRMLEFRNNVSTYALT
jgi:hypothetical protein